MAALPGQMFDHQLNPAKGWPHPAALDFVAKAAAGVAYSLRAGQCCHINSTKALEPGVQLTQMPLFIFQGATDYDVDGRGNNQWTPVIPQGDIMAIVGISATELETTEYLPTLTYAPNDLLRAPVGNSSGAEALDANGKPTTSSSGVLRNDTITLYTTAVVGCVSRGVIRNYNNINMLAFWPCFLPGTV